MKCMFPILFGFAALSISGDAFADPVAGAPAGPDVQIIEQGYPDAIYYLVRFAEGMTFELSVMDSVGDSVSGSFETISGDVAIHIFRPDEALALGTYQARVVNQTPIVNVEIVERSDERTLTANVTPMWYEIVGETATCEGQRYPEKSYRLGLEMSARSSAPMALEARLLRDDNLAGTKFYTIAGNLDRTLVADTDSTANETVCAELIATEIENDELVVETIDCVDISEFPVRPQGSSISAEIRECWERERAESGGCSNVRGGGPSWMVLLFVAVLAVRRRATWFS